MPIENNNNNNNKYNNKQKERKHKCHINSQLLKYIKNKAVQIYKPHNKQRKIYQTIYTKNTTHCKNKIHVTTRELQNYKNTTKQKVPKYQTIQKPQNGIQNYRIQNITNTKYYIYV